MTGRTAVTVQNLYGRNPRESLLFFARVCASLSHEMNNVLSTVGEVAGLLEDLAGQVEAGHPLAAQRVGSQCDRIAAQLARGKALVGGLNQLAHSVDGPSEPLDLAGVVQTATGLMRRFAELKCSSIEFADRGRVPATCDRFTVIEFVGTLVEFFLDAGPAPEPIRIGVRLEGDRAKLTVSGPNIPSGMADDARLAYVGMLAKALGGTMNTSDGGGGRTVITLDLPAGPEGGDAPK
jgi:signal transduction histidine kinase